jgi:hypothetical protein
MQIPIATSLKEGGRILDKKKQKNQPVFVNPSFIGENDASDQS